MESVYHIVTICVNETSWAHVWRLRSHYLRTGYDTMGAGARGELLWLGSRHSQAKCLSFPQLRHGKLLARNYCGGLMAAYCGSGVGARLNCCCCYCSGVVLEVEQVLCLLEEVIPVWK
jgi:hypothetical protein